MRLFIAIQFDDAILDALTDLQDDLRAYGIRGYYTKRENLHMTLAFIGEYGNSDAVLDAMDEVAFTPFDIRLSGVGVFHQLFWAGIEENVELSDYVKHLRRELASRGIPYDRKRFSPHITLVRKFSGDLSAIEVFDTTMTVNRISLMKSVRGRNGMVYTEIGGVDA